MQSNTTRQRLLLYPVNPHETNEITSQLPLQEGWTIEQVSLSPYGKDSSHVVVAIVLAKRAGGGET